MSRRSYPTTSLRATPSSKANSAVLKSPFKKLPKIVTPPEKIREKTDGDGKASSDSVQESADEKTRKESPIRVSDDKKVTEGEPTKEESGMNLDQYASLVSSSLLVAAIGEIVLADKIERKALTDVQERADDSSKPQETSGGKEVAKKDSRDSSRDSGPQKVPVSREKNNAAMDARVPPASAEAADTLPGILRSANGRPGRSREGRVSAQFLGGRISFTPQSRQSRRSEAPRSGSSRYRHSAFTSSAASTTDFFQREKLAALGKRLQQF